VLSAKKLLPLGVVVALGGCAAVPPPPPAVTVVPGTGKDAAAFLQDELVCQQHAVAKTGYGTPAQASAAGVAPYNGSSAASGSPPRATNPANPAAVNLATANPPIAALPGAEPPDEVAYMQCMASRGNVVETLPAMAAAYPAYPYPYGYAYGYPDVYPGYYDGYYGGWGWGGGWYGGGYGWGRGGWGRGGWGRGGWGGRGGFGGGRGGFGGGHGGFGGGHGGGGGGHR
jgi:hypothetical protein